MVDRFVFDIRRLTAGGNLRQGTERDSSFLNFLSRSPLQVGIDRSKHSSSENSRILNVVNCNGARYKLASLDMASGIAVNP